jgi:hypothetical protein
MRANNQSLGHASEAKGHGFDPRQRTNKIKGLGDKSR